MLLKAITTGIINIINNYIEAQRCHGAGKVWNWIFAWQNYTCSYCGDLLIDVRNILSLAAEKYEPSDSWVFSSDPTALNWLKMQGGIRGILPYCIPYFEQSIWNKVFMEADDGNEEPSRVKGE